MSRIVYVVFGPDSVHGVRDSRPMAEARMAEVIEGVYTIARDAGNKAERNYDVCATLFVADQQPIILTSFDPEELRSAVRGVSAVEMNVAGSLFNLRIGTAELTE